VLRARAAAQGVPSTARRGSSCAPAGRSPPARSPTRGRGSRRRRAGARRRRPRAVGVDAPSVDGRESKALETHHALFGAGAYNLENLDLRGAPPGRYELVAPPLSLAGLDAAPARALLRPLS
jgi:hypothetical protein